MVVVWRRRALPCAIHAIASNNTAATVAAGAGARTLGLQNLKCTSGKALSWCVLHGEEVGMIERRKSERRQYDESP